MTCTQCFKRPATCVAAIYDARRGQEALGEQQPLCRYCLGALRRKVNRERATRRVERDAT